jgi:hypothetical protein
MPAGRPPIYTEELADAICERLCMGESLRRITKDEGMPSIATVMRWLLNIPEFDNKYARARQLQAEVWADEMIDIADDATNDYMEKKGKEGSFELNPENIQRSKMRLEQRRWYAEKLRPKVYGPKLAIGGAADLPPINTTKTLDVSNLSIEELDVLAAALEKSLIKDE